MNTIICPNWEMVYGRLTEMVPETETEWVALRVVLRLRLLSPAGIHRSPQVKPHGHFSLPAPALPFFVLTLWILAVNSGLAIMLSVVHAQDKIPVPPAQAQTEALELIREVYGQTWNQAETSAQRQALATTLLERSRELTDAADRYMLLHVAQGVAVQAGDVELAFKVIITMAQTFDVDAYRLKGAALKQTAKSARTEQSVAVGKLSLDLIDEAVDRDDFDAAKFLGDLALEAARKARDPHLTRQVAARNREVEKIADTFASISAARATLNDNPVDPDANLAVGWYYCFWKDNWNHGLPMLALGSDPELKKLALIELRGVSDAQGQMALGDAWWDAASAREGFAQERLQGRAAYWYRKVLPNVRGLTQDKVERRLKEIADAAAAQESAPESRALPPPKKQARKRQPETYFFVHEAAVREHWEINGPWRIDREGIRLFERGTNIRLKKQLQGDVAIRIGYDSGRHCDIDVYVFGERLRFSSGNHVATIIRKDGSIFYTKGNERPVTVKIRQEQSDAPSDLKIQLSSTYLVDHHFLIRGVAILSE